jgi:hypothetical protein
MDKSCARASRCHNVHIVHLVGCQTNSSKKFGNQQDKDRLLKADEYILKT